MSKIIFPDNFYWGAATAAYQIEGACNADGKGQSIWDTFTHIPGKITGNTNGDIACNSYHQYEEDIQLLLNMHLNSYRFSFSWPRILPNGFGKIEKRGLDFYKRFIEKLLIANIRPLPTLYHWDLPQQLEDIGGWANRDTAKYFAEFALLIAKEFGDILTTVATFNEPYIFTRYGYFDGYHAPGKTNADEYLRTTHTVNLAQGLATLAIKSQKNTIQVGCVHSVSPGIPKTQNQEDIQATESFHAYYNQWFLLPILSGKYPELAYSEEIPLKRMGYENNDDKTMKVGLDWIGLNYYFPHVIHAINPSTLDTSNLPLNFSFAPLGGFPMTDFRWPVYPEGLSTILERIYKDCGNIPFEITESGCSYQDGPTKNGSIPDIRRIEYLKSHLKAINVSMKKGIDIRGYHHWTLLDNFEWAEGYTQRFGLTYVDFRTQIRTIKDSGFYYKEIAKNNYLLDTEG